MAALLAGCPDNGEDKKPDDGKSQVTEPQRTPGTEGAGTDDPKTADPATGTANPDGQEGGKPAEQPQPQVVVVPEKPKPRIAVVDVDLVYEKSSLSHRSDAYIDELEKNIKIRLAEIDKALEAAPEDKELAEKLKLEYLEMQSALAAEKQRAASTLTEVFNKTVDAYIREKDLDVVLPKQLVTGVKPEVEITKEIIRRMDRSKVKLVPPKALQNLEPKPAEPAPAAAEGAAAPAGQPDAAPSGK